MDSEEELFQAFNKLEDNNGNEKWICREYYMARDLEDCRCKKMTPEFKKLWKKYVDQYGSFNNNRGEILGVKDMYYTGVLFEGTQYIRSTKKSKEYSNQIEKKLEQINKKENKEPNLFTKIFNLFN